MATLPIYGYFASIHGYFAYIHGYFAYIRGYFIHGYFAYIRGYFVCVWLRCLCMATVNITLNVSYKGNDKVYRMIFLLLYLHYKERLKYTLTSTG